MDGIRAFRQAYVSAGSLDSADYGDVEARQFRYLLYWAFYENTIYQNVHQWSTHYRQLEGLYRYIRGIYNPSYRIGEFWRSHIWGGTLDFEAGTGEGGNATAIPIITDNDKIRPAIGQVWRWSNWQTFKGICSLHGAVMGDPKSLPSLGVIPAGCSRVSRLVPSLRGAVRRRDYSTKYLQSLDHPNKIGA